MLALAASFRFVVPDPVMLPRVSVGVRPVDACVVNVTVPVNPFTSETVIREVWLVPCSIVRVVGAADSVKPETCTVIDTS
jgi:hypothetical protein